MKNKSYLLKYAIDYLSKFNTSKKNLERILKMKIQRASKDKKERFNLYSQIDYVLNELERNKLINDQTIPTIKFVYLLHKQNQKDLYKIIFFKKELKKILFKKN